MEGIVAAAVEKKGRYFIFASDRLKSDRQFVLRSGKISAAALMHGNSRWLSVPTPFKNDMEVVLQAVSTNVFVLQELEADMKNWR